jgi:murein DD-endopeptidase MepM/ murein hydrolase activator NlpD
MQIMITHSGLGRTRALTLSRWQLMLTAGTGVLLLLLFSGTVYHFVFLKVAREGWPVVSQLVKLVVRDELAQHERYMRENLDAMAGKVGEMQARVVRLEAMEDRVRGLAGVKAEDLKVMQVPATNGVGARPVAAPAVPASASKAPGTGGPYIPLDHPSLEQLHQALDALEQRVDQHGDLLTLAESRLLESRLRALMVPNSRPIDAPTASGFGFRSDPFTGRPALHTGLDFSAEVGTPIHAAAGGVVLSTDYHPQYGQLLELDHGNGLVTRYAHTSRILVKAGDLVKRGQEIALVGNTGRSTGPHLHFEVVVSGVPHDPVKFLQPIGPASVAKASAAAAVPARP